MLTWLSQLDVFPPQVLVLLTISSKKYFLNSCYYFSINKKSLQCRPENTYFDSLCQIINRRENKLVYLLDMCIFPINFTIFILICLEVAYRIHYTLFLHYWAVQLEDRHKTNKPLCNYNCENHVEVLSAGRTWIHCPTKKKIITCFGN